MMAVMTVTPLPAGTYRLLTYDYVPDVLERRDPVRPAHLEHAGAAQRRGDLVNAGAVGTPPTGALFVFADVDPGVVEAFVQADPYRQAGLVTGYRVQPWTVVV
jgi:hypothetical protein